MPIGLTAEIGAFAARMAHDGARDGAPAAALPTVRLGFTDCAAVILAGRGARVTEIVRGYAASRGGTAESRLLFGNERLPAGLTAMVNAVAAHAMDWDDYAFANHPSAVLVPTIMAMAEITAAPGPAMAAAYVAGYESWACLMEREPDHLHGKGWHPTGLFGPIAAAVAAAVLLRFDADQARHAAAIAASHAGSVMANFGTDTKPYHGGKAAEAGITAALLARHGLEGGPAAIEDRIGLLAALSPHGRVDRDSPGRLGERWRITTAGLNIKKYPTVGASQRTIESVLDWRAANRVDPDQVQALIPVISAKQAAVMNFHHPQTAPEAKFSLEFATAAPLLAGRLGAAEMQEEFIRSPALQALMAKVAIETVEIYDPDYPVAAPEAFVRIRMADGTEHLTPPVTRARGHADRPLPLPLLREKFTDCATLGGVAPAQADRLFEAMQSIDTLGGVADIPTI